MCVCIHVERKRVLEMKTSERKKEPERNAIVLSASKTSNRDGLSKKEKKRFNIKKYQDGKKTIWIHK